MLDVNKYVVAVEHDLAVLDYLSDFICCLYGKPGAYGVVTMPFSVREVRLCWQKKPCVGPADSQMAAACWMLTMSSCMACMASEATWLAHGLLCIRELSRSHDNTLRTTPEHRTCI